MALTEISRYDFDEGQLQNQINGDLRAGLSGIESLESPSPPRIAEIAIFIVASTFSSVYLP